MFLIVTIQTAKTKLPSKSFLGDNDNTIEMQIWAAVIANLLLNLAWSKPDYQ